MDELKRILAQAIEKNACAEQLEPFRRFIEEGDELSAWQTVLGNIGWIKRKRIQVPVNLEQLAENQGKTWHNDGTLSSHEFYKNGLLNGDYKQWHNDGTLCVHKVYENGKLHGEFNEWYMNGSLWIHGFYHYGKLHGERKIWFSDGKLCRHELYDNGNLIKSLL